MPALTAVVMHLADVTASPCATCLPGSSALQKIINGVMYFAEGGLLLALMVGAASWALGRHSGNYRATEAGKSTVLVSMVGAVLVGGATAIINFFLGAGAGI
jgi:hypothetical protein